MDSPSTPTTEASPRVYYSRFSLDDINITSSTTYEIHETDSFIYNPSFASSETSIASYKTERTINSRKSRYNTLPRRKYAGIGIPHGLVSLGVDAVEVCRPIGRRDRHDYTSITFQTSSRQHPSAEVTSLRKQLCAEMRPKLATLVEYMYGFNTSQAHASIIYNARRAQELLRDRNFIYPEPRTGHDPYRHPIIQRAIDTTWFRNKDDIGVADHEYFSPMPVSVIAITLTVIEYYIDEWSYGTRRNSSWDDAKFQTVYDSHVSSFLNFQARGPASDRDVLYQLQCDLLRNAREHAGVIDSSDPRVIEENTIFAREMKSRLGSNWGFPSDLLMDGMLDYVAKWSQLKLEKRGNKRLDEARTLNKPGTAGGILVDRMLGYVAKHTPSEQEKRGDRWLEDAYSLTAEYRPLINSRHLEEIEEKRQYARNIKSGLDSRQGAFKVLVCSRICQGC
ncbi:hypothetical protein BJY52DRAFT_135038 [Lactarius psammicola]|nr:hypothetical protein BJY52DRAFT_135038 [Lactarius psammicola]